MGGMRRQLATDSKNFSSLIQLAGCEGIYEGYPIRKNINFVTEFAV
jgi:hypothetical protein